MACCQKPNPAAARRSQVLSRRATIVATRAAKKAAKACPSGGCKKTKPKAVAAKHVAPKGGTKPCLCGGPQSGGAHG